jgi:hypothetical protein
MHPTIPSNSNRFVASLLVFLTFGLPAGVALVDQGVPTLLVSPEEFNAGELRPNSKAFGDLRLSNPGPNPVEIRRIRTSCPCLTITLDKLALAPGESIRAKMTLDLSREPDFRGGLLIEAVGEDAEGELAFSVSLRCRFLAN